ncbi:MAG: hypothetical protein K6G71_05720 [Clostridiales bacterium]|nr:hypothetical protein [Clostridiales bacterium]
MKRVIFTVFALTFCFIVAFAVSGSAGEAAPKTYHIDSIDGNDSANGLSASSAWRSPINLTGITFAPGDRVLFRRGGVYSLEFAPSGSGAQGAPVTVSAYGEGEAPLLTTSGGGAVITLRDVSYWTVENLEITAPNGSGVLVTFSDATVGNVILRNLKIHNISNYVSSDFSAGDRAAIRLQGGSNAPGTHLENISVTDCEIYDCAYGINISGNRLSSADSPYNSNISVANIYMHDTLHDGIIMQRTDGMLLNNSVFLRCAMSDDHYTCPTWFNRVNNGLMQYCEIAGSANYKDGMSIDFDNETNNTTAQYIYSHDNCRFLWCCMWSSSMYNNTVRYCLSVNDNSTPSGTCHLEGSDYFEYQFKMYNNTVVNCREFIFSHMRDSTIKNNIFVIADARVFFDDSDEARMNVSNNCYYRTLGPSPAWDYYKRDSVFGDPGFVGSDYSDMDSFMLKTNSKLIGAGVKVEEDMGGRDLWGHGLTDSHNIGCYEGKGVRSVADTHKVSYNTTYNGGSGADSYNVYIEKGEKADISGILAPLGERAFIGWNTDRNAKEGLSSLKVGDEDVTLYAIWEPAPEPVEPTTERNTAPRIPVTYERISYSEIYSIGDVDADGMITAVDARLALLAAAKLTELDKSHSTLADMDRDGIISAIDARRILRLAAKLDSEAGTTSFDLFDIM